MFIKLKVCFAFIPVLSLIALTSPSNAQSPSIQELNPNYFEQLIQTTKLNDPEMLKGLTEKDLDSNNLLKAYNVFKQLEPRLIQEPSNIFMLVHKLNNPNPYSLPSAASTVIEVRNEKTFSNISTTNDLGEEELGEEELGEEDHTILHPDSIIYNIQDSLENRSTYYQGVPSKDYSDISWKEYPVPGKNPPSHTSQEMVRTTNCQDVVYQILNLSSSAIFPNFPEDLDDIDNINTNELFEKINLADTFDNKCLLKFDSLPTSLREKVLKIVGIISIKTPSDGSSKSRVLPLCTATRVTKDILLTAKHCLDKLTKDHIKNNLSFTFFAYPDIAYKIDDEMLNRDYDSLENPDEYNEKRDTVDYTFLKLSNIDIPFEDFEFDVPQLKESLVLYGVNLFVFQKEYYNLILNFSSLNSSDFVNTARWDNGPGCHISSIYSPSEDKPDEVCIYHGCQAEGSLSGAPIFRFNNFNEKIQIVGMHIASGRKKSGKCYASGLEDGNIAIGITNEIRDMKRNFQTSQVNP